jgi:hypothetical protein
MNMLFTTLLLCILCLSSVAQVIGQPVVARFTVTGASPLEALAKLSAASGVPFGIEWLGDGQTPLISGDWHEASTTSIVRDIIRAAHGKRKYTTIWRGQILEIRPAEKVRKTHSMGDLNIGDVNIRNAEPGYARAELQQWAAVKGFPQLHPMPLTFVYMGGFMIGDCPEYFEIQHATVIQALDQIVVASCMGEKLWVILEDPAKKVDHSQYWPTLYLKSGEQAPALQEPVLTLLYWREDPHTGGSRPDWHCPKCPQH